MDRTLVIDECTLTHLEWDRNEVNLSHSTKIINMVTYGLGIVASWKGQLESCYARTSFDIILSVDNGDEDITALERKAERKYAEWGRIRKMGTEAMNGNALPF